MTPTTQMTAAEVVERLVEAATDREFIANGAGRRHMLPSADKELQEARDALVSLIETEANRADAAEKQAAYWNERFEFQCKLGDKQAMDLYTAIMGKAEAERELAEIRGRLERAPRGIASVTADKLHRQFVARVRAEYELGPCFTLDGQRVAIVALQDGEG